MGKVRMETSKGTLVIELFEDEAPETVKNFVGLITGEKEWTDPKTNEKQKGKPYYDGLRFHRAEANFLVQIGDPKSRDMSLREWWGRYGSGKPIGVAEITKKRRNIKGAVGMAHTGSAKDADSQFYITLRAAPELDTKFAVFGHVIKGMEVVSTLQKADVLKKASVRE